jgi:hypothetical protein
MRLRRVLHQLYKVKVEIECAPAKTQDGIGACDGTVRRWPAWDRLISGVICHIGCVEAKTEHRVDDVKRKQTRPLTMTRMKVAHILTYATRSTHWSRTETSRVLNDEMPLSWLATEATGAVPNYLH